MSRLADLDELIEVSDRNFDSDNTVSFEVINRKNKKERLLFDIHPAGEGGTVSHTRRLAEVAVYDWRKIPDLDNKWVGCEVIDNGYEVNQWSQTTTDFPKGDQKRLDYHETFDDVIYDLCLHKGVEGEGKFTRDELNDFLDDYFRQSDYNVRMVY